MKCVLEILNDNTTDPATSFTKMNFMNTDDLGINQDPSESMSKFEDVLNESRIHQEDFKNIKPPRLCQMYLEESL